MFGFFRSLFRRVVRFVQRIGRAVEELVQDLEPEQIETATRTVVRISFAYRTFIARCVEVIFESIINTVKEYQWEPQPN
jgi:hypothetical protein